MSTRQLRLPTRTEQQLPSRVEVSRRGDDEAHHSRLGELTSADHYLKDDTQVGKYLRHVALINGQWVALLIRSAVAHHLEDCEDWLGWSAGHAASAKTTMPNMPSPGNSGCGNWCGRRR